VRGAFDGVRREALNHRGSLPGFARIGRRVLAAAGGGKRYGTNDVTAETMAPSETGLTSE
jgi:hypothetical protein